MPAYSELAKEIQCTIPDWGSIENFGGNTTSFIRIEHEIKLQEKGIANREGPYTLEECQSSSGWLLRK
jgi:hypothetical protein